MNPLFMSMMNGVNGNPMFNMMNALQQIKQMQQNPNGLCDLLLQKGKITEQQYNEMKQFNGNPQMIGEYLMQNGSINRQDATNMVSNVVPNIQNELNKHQN